MKLRHAMYANAVLFAILNPISHSFAADDDSRGQGNGRRGPPQEALEACASGSAGDACSFTGRNNQQMSGTCFAPQEKKLACKPAGHNRRGKQGGQRNGRGYGQGNGPQSEQDAS